MYTPKTNPEQKHVVTTQEHEKVHYYYTTRLAGWLTRRGELGYSQWRAKGEQTLLSVTQSFAVANGWRANTALCHVVARRGEQTTRRDECDRFSVGKCDFSPQKPNFHQP